MTTTRERKLKFLSDYRVNLRANVAKLLCERGPDWLTDKQLDDIVQNEIHSCKRSLRMNRMNRNRAKVVA